MCILAWAFRIAPNLFIETIFQAGATILKLRSQVALTTSLTLKAENKSRSDTLHIR